MEKLVEKYVINDTEYESTLEEDLEIDPTNLHQAFAEHAGKFAWYANAYEVALKEVKNVKDDVALLYANLDARVRADMERNGVKVTEKKVEGNIISHPEYVRAMQVLREHEHMAGLLKAARDSMETRKDMLISLGANIRAEMKSFIS